MKSDTQIRNEKYESKKRLIIHGCEWDATEPKRNYLILFTKP